MQWEKSVAPVRILEGMSYVQSQFCTCTLTIQKRNCGFGTLPTVPPLNMYPCPPASLGPRPSPASLTPRPSPASLVPRPSPTSLAPTPRQQRLVPRPSPASHAPRPSSSAAYFELSKHICSQKSRGEGGLVQGYILNFHADCMHWASSPQTTRLYSSHLHVYTLQLTEAQQATSTNINS